MFKIKVGGVPEHFNYPWLKCLEEGLFEKAGLEVNWENYPGGTGEMTKALYEEEIDLAIMLTEGSLKAIESGKNFTIVQKYIESPLIWGIHVDAESPIQKVEDLKGKTAAISRYNSGSHLMTHVLAEQESWDLKNLKFKVCKTLNGAIEALKNKESDFFLWERFTTKPYVDQNVLKHLNNCPTPWPCFVIVARENYYKRHQHKIDELLSVLNEQTSELKKKDNLSNVLSQRYDIKTEDVEKWLSKTEWSNSEMQPETMEYLKTKLKKYNII